MKPSLPLALVVIASAVLPAGTTAAQDAASAPPTWVGSFGAGLAITSGNTNTSNWNVSFKAKRERPNGLILNADGLVIQGKRSGRPSLDNTVLNSRAELRFADKSYVFGQMAYLRDPFKSINYFFAPTAGLSYRFYDTTDGSFSVNASAGASWESNPGKPVTRKPALAFGQRFTRALSKTATLTQGFAGNVVANDVGDGLYSTSVGVAASVTNRTQMKVEVLSTYRTTPPVATIRKSDVSTIMSFVFKF